MPDPSPRTTSPRTTRGVLLVMGAVLLFALSDTVTKHLTPRYPVPVVMLLRYLVNVALMLAILYPGQGRALWRTRRTLLVTLRGLVLCAASLTMGLALRVMPVAETAAIVYLAPFAVMVLAMPLLGEKVRVAGWVGAGLGFLGVFLIVRPGGDLPAWGVVLSLINAGFATTYSLMTKILSRSESTNALLFNTAVVGVVVFAVLSAGLWRGPVPGSAMPGFGDMALMGLLGVLMSGGHFLFTAANREAPASTLAPLTYVQLVWSGGLGWLVFGHIPDGVSLAGMAMVVMAGATIALGAHLDGRRARRVTQAQATR